MCIDLSIDIHASKPTIVAKKEDDDDNGFFDSKSEKVIFEETKNLELREVSGTNDGSLEILSSRPCHDWSDLLNENTEEII